jgi:archaellum biogenesis ATPase FlaH
LSAFIADRSNFDTASPYVSKDDLSPTGAVLLDIIAQYYKRDEHVDHVDLDLMRSALERRFRDVPKHLDTASELLEVVLSEDASHVNVITEVLEQQRTKARLKLADALLAQDEDMIEEYLTEYSRLTDATVLESSAEEEYVGATLDQLAEQFETDGAWTLAPKALANRIRGGVRPGHAVVMAARPERGKTLFGVNLCAGFLSQGAKVLYLGNEDPIPDIVLRLLSNLSNMTEAEMMRDKETAMERARARGYDNCILQGISPGTLYEVEALVRRHSPDVVIVDQMRNIRANTENNTQRLEVVAQELRNIGRRHRCVMISMTQVGDSGRDKLILNDGDIDGSNTGIPGACDVIVMIGSNEEYELRDLRKLTLAKNKRGGSHDSFTVSVDREHSRVTSYEEFT